MIRLTKKAAIEYIKISNVIFKYLNEWGEYKYRQDFYKQLYSIDKLPIHQCAHYLDHKKYGAFVYSYKRNSQTVWYFIYDIIGSDNGTPIIKINRITNNYRTLQGIK